MKWKNYLLIAALGLLACNENTEEALSKKENALPKLNVWEVPAAGAEVAKYVKNMEEDKLNKSTFEVVITANDSTASNGSFDINIVAGTMNENLNKLFPKWYENNLVKPEIRAMDSVKYGAVIGFDPGDGSFNDIYIVSFKDNELKFSQTKMYYNSAK